MTIYKWHVHVATILFLMGAPSLLAQDFLKQLEAKLSQKQQESKGKEQPPAAGTPSKESSSDPLEFPSILEPEGLPAPGQLKPDQEKETIELTAPSAERKTPKVTRSPKLPPTPAENSAQVRPVPSPFPRAVPNATTQPPVKTPKVTRSPKLPPTPAENSAQVRPVPSPFPRAVPNATTQPPVGGGGFLGLTVESIPGGGFGLTVVEVAPDSPAWKAGFKNGDKVIGVSGQAVSTVDAFAEQLTRFAPGAPVKFLVDRRGRTANLIAVLQDRAIAGQIHGTRPGTAVESNSGLNPIAGNRLGQAYFGVNVSDMSDAYRKQFGIPAYRGASVTEVVPSSPAHLAGLKPGDCIVEIEGATVQSAEVVMETILRSKPGQVISFSFYRGRQLVSASVPLVSDSPTLGGPPSTMTPEMLTPEYVASLQGELQRVHNELSETQARLQQLEARLLRMENNR